MIAVGLSWPLHQSIERTPELCSAYTERRGSCKMASFSDVKLKAP